MKKSMIRFFMSKREVLRELSEWSADTQAVVRFD